MFDRILKHMSLESQGICSLVLGFILIFGTLGKLQILQGILNSVMILTGIILVMWGIKSVKGFEKLKNCIQPKQQ